MSVCATVRDDYIEVAVADEGIGIAPGDHERIFERFVQGETGDRRRFGGIGLGLYIARRLARAQGGELTAQSRPEGGPVMTFRLAGAEPGSVAGHPGRASRDAERPARNCPMAHCAPYRIVHSRPIYALSPQPSCG